MGLNSTVRYTKGHLVVNFPADEVATCQMCPCLGAEAITMRRYCRRTGEFLQHPDHQIGFDCPMEFEVPLED